MVPDRRNGRYAEISVIYHAAILVCRFYVGRAEQPVINICVLILYTLLIMLASAALFGRKSVVSKA